MRALIQRVSSARVQVQGRTIGEIGAGLLVLLGVGQHDDVSIAVALAKKTAALRIFEDTAGRMNLALGDIAGAALVVSQFTLFADCSKGRRPFFGAAGDPAVAAPLCQAFVAALEELGVPTATGEFGAMMQVSLCNDGPVTIWLDSDDLGLAPRA